MFWKFAKGGIIDTNKKAGAATPQYRRPTEPPRPLQDIDELSRETASRPLYEQGKWALVKIDRVTQTRPCKVDGAPALFHMFVENDRGVLQINTFCNADTVNKMIKDFNENNFMTNACTLEKLRSTMALIEWPDGRLSTVAVERVQFTDREGAKNG